MRALIEAFDPDIPIEDAWTPPSGWYTDPDVYVLERAAVFASSWQPVARLEQVSNVGDYVAGCFAGEPWVVVRASDGVRAFSNVCRHKGREVVTGSGHADSLVCGYHAWSYDLDGTLRKAPQMAGVRGFDRAQMSLPELRTFIWGPWVFVSHDAVEPELGELTRRLDASGWKDLQWAGSRSWTLECNWKVYVDNYLDGGYHVPHMHPSLNAQLDMSTYGTEIFDTYSIQSSGSEAQRTAGGALYAWLFPNFMINRYGACLDSNHVVPLGPSRCRVDYDFFFDASVSPEAIEESMRQSDVTQREDIEICESVQRGLVSQHYDRGRYAPRVEQGEHHFHRLLARCYRDLPKIR